MMGAIMESSVLSNPLDVLRAARAAASSQGSGALRALASSVGAIEEDIASEALCRLYVDDRPIVAPHIVRTVKCVAVDMCRSLLGDSRAKRPVKLVFGELHDDIQGCDDTARLGEQKEISKAVKLACREALTWREEYIVLCYFFDGHTLKSIGRSLGIGESRASQIMSRTVLPKLRRWMRKHRYTRSALGLARAE